MYVIKGKYNIAKIMLPENEYLEEETTTQIYGFLNNEAFKGDPIVIMPDSHAGKGAVIGFTMPLNNYVVPNVVGVDIGCGMLACEINGSNINFEKLDNFISNNIPNGHSIYDNRDNLKDLSRAEIELYLSVSERVDQKVDVLHSLGTLGGGNHFVEIDKTDYDKFYLVIHSGSRNFGLKVCDYHVNVAKKQMREFFTGDAYKGLEFLPLEHGGKDYLDDMRIAQQYAMVNRNIMMKKIMTEFFNIPKKEWIDTKIECIHNYINFNDLVVRKGAISAHAEEDVIIPLNMKDGIIFGKGRGNKEWNNSAPHGAGRILSRKKAKAELNLDDVKEQMKDVWTASLNEHTLDEAPDAYKDSSMIIEAIEETVEIIDIAKPVYNFKAS